ncbi:MAG TPA: NAD(P)/FAD-dependent oxidoreductase [Bacteroidales bacterium]|nr:NAD(P)/FAD-dependent oxidoreductase [Bacteroidales bacterium]HRZ48564.1 NAD(P)/FAD-dependent oxidoreductase [Bacteroidales bacterium]
MAENSYSTIVVGGGIAGLTAAVFQAQAGRKVLLIEMNEKCGGLVNTFNRNGFRFDAGVRALLDAGIIFPMLKNLGAELETVKSYVSLGIGPDIIHIKTIENLKDYAGLLKKHFPEDGADIDALIRIIRRIMKHMDVLYGIENPVFKDLKHDLDFIFKKILPWFPKFLFTVRKINRMKTPVETYLEDIIKNPALRDVVAQHFFKNTPAFFALSYFSLYLDYFYPKGGVGTLAETLAAKTGMLGGEIKTGRRVTSVDPASRFVMDDLGNIYRYDNLIWAADLKKFYAISKTDHLAPEVRNKAEETKARFLQHRGGDSIFTLFLQVDLPPEYFSEKAHGHFFYTPLAEGLGETHRRELDVLLERFTETSREEVLDWLDRYIRLNTFEISIPCLKDPVMAPGGKTGVIISLLAEYLLFKKVEEAGWLPEFIQEIEARIIRVISGSVYPGLAGHIRGQFSFTPLSIEHRVGSSEGGITGWAFTESMPVIDRIQIADRSVQTPIPHVYQAGQWVYSPGGVPMSILTGKLASDKVLKQKAG